MGVMFLIESDISFQIKGPFSKKIVWLNLTDSISEKHLNYA